MNVNIILEFIAALSAIFYVVLAAKQCYLCWPISILSTLIYMGLYFNVHLYLESILQIFYLILSIYGWIFWQKNETKFLVTKNSFGYNFLSIFTLLIVSLILSFIASNHSDISMPYLDAPIFIFSLYATFITAKKKLESWTYWIVIDLISGYVSFSKGLRVTSVLFFVYVVLAIFGFYEWRKSLKIVQ